MRLDDYKKKEGKRVWLTVEELAHLLDETATPQQRVAVALGGKSGLRRSEITSVTWNDFQYAPSGFVRVWNDYAKRDKYREAPVPDDVRVRAQTITSDQSPDAAVVDVHGTTVYRWVRRCAERMQASTGDPGWQYLDVHDLRRSWGGHLLWNCGVLPAVVREFGGWSDPETFREHYMGAITPEAAQRERGKIDYMGGEPAASVAPFEPRSEAAKDVFQ